jgi:hypothetical protein
MLVIHKNSEHRGIKYQPENTARPYLALSMTQAAGVAPRLFINPN